MDVEAAEAAETEVAAVVAVRPEPIMAAAATSPTGIIGIIEEGAVPTAARGALDTPPHRQKPVVIGITSMVTKLTTA